MHKGIIGTLAGCLASAPAFAQQPSAGELLRDIERLQVVGSVLYVAAHPDDENTRLLAYLVGERGLSATYLSMTRGGGGQNLVGPEQAELLGVVRTGELLAARSIDGAEQRFTRMRDFGYSKSAEETLALWGRDEALADVVQAIREVRPDVIVTRFATDQPSHGHHVASAILAGEAFGASGDATRFPGLEPWQADRLLYNRSQWTITPETDTSGWLAVDVGGYDPLLGRSWGEIAATSRTQHKSQGFGSAPQVGPQPEFFSPLAGTPLSPGQDPLEGLDLTWGRFPGTGKLIRTLETAVRRFDPAAPHEVLPTLARAHGLMADVPDAHWRAVKTAELEQVIVDAAGLWLTARADRASVAPGGTAKVTVTALARNPADVTLHGVRILGAPRPDGGGLASAEGGPLAVHAPWHVDVDVAVPADHPLTQPHWLVQPPSASRYVVDDPALRTAADTPASLLAAFDLTIAGVRMTVVRPVQFAWTDPVAGERAHPLEVLPPVTATFDQRAVVVPADGTTVRLVLRSRDAATGVLRLAAEGFDVTPAEIPFELPKDGERVAEARLTGGAQAGTLTATAEVDGRAFAFQEAVIDYAHLPKRTVLQPAAVPIAPVVVDRGDTQRIGYVTGSGDAVPDALRAVGYTVEPLDADAIATGDLSRFDAIVMGIRAYNTQPRLLALHEPLMAYVAQGGRLVVQYNTNNRFDPLDGPVGPHPFTIGRDRVTDETAALTPVDPAHPALTAPNALGPADFDGWVQERGLYFASEWDPAYTPLFSSHDPGEERLLGSTLVARHGEGVFVYTGLSLFRQLPAGVPGAYRLLANLLAL